MCENKVQPPETESAADNRASSPEQPASPVEEIPGSGDVVFDPDIEPEVRPAQTERSTAEERFGDGEYYSLPASDPAGLFFRALVLFSEAKPKLGEQEAREIIRSATSAKASLIAKKWRILQRFDAMEPERSPWKLACQLAEENETLPPADRWGPRGSINAETLEHYIHDAIKERKQAIERGTWRGPGGPVRPIAKVAMRIQTR